MNSNWKVKSNAEKNFFEKDFPLKREALRKLAVQPELEDILDTMTNESIVYDSEFTYFAEPFIEQSELAMFNRKTRKKIENTVSGTYAKLYKMLDWKYRAWDDFKRFLVEGILSWEIVYDSLEKPTRIIGLVPLDPATLTKKAVFVSAKSITFVLTSSVQINFCFLSKWQIFVCCTACHWLRLNSL